MSNAIAGLPPTNRYESLKALLVEHYSLSRGQELRKLLSGLSIKGQKPSRLLAEMRSLAGTGRFDKEDLKTLFLEYLPNDVRMTLQVVSGDVYALAAVADKIIEHRPPDSGQELMAIQKPTDSLASQLAEITRRLDEMQTRLESTVTVRSRPRSRTRSRSRTASRDSSHGDKVCYYHRRFKEHALNAKNPVVGSRRNRTSRRR